MTKTGAGQAEDRARKAAEARERAAEAARRAREAEAEAAAALREAEEAEAAAKAEAEAATAAEEAEAEAEEIEGSEEAAESAESKADLTKTTTEDDAEDDAEETAKHEEDDDEGKPAGRRRRRWLPPLGTRSYVLIAVNLALAGALGWLVVAVQGLKADERAVQQVTFAAKQAAEDLSSYDYRTIDADLKRASDHTTGDFRNDFTRMTATVKPSALQQKAVVEGTAVRTSVESVDGRKAIALVYLNQATAKAATAERTPSQYTLRLVMTKVGDRWLVSQLQMM
ncbi:hypothetical protein Acsp03_50680 [Actinomadura sp. NBRC 104412]|uniref:hypothetical protein n=1 Tax=Actinomadura sp. NBRC 104412 TaxID=3032203 RepID=UPI0024A07DF9|nr:hypothetical protein [Actinomadura sp. NBRC 104412]GLZ07602.1 hypothetical protein Acsp03_50680 [Actinomadura sp. NBRC 104412]